MSDMINDHGLDCKSGFNQQGLILNIDFHSQIIALCYGKIAASTDNEMGIASAIIVSNGKVKMMVFKGSSNSRSGAFTWLMSG